MKLILENPLKVFKITQRFGNINAALYSPFGHNGIDCYAPHATPIYASHDGFASYQVDSGGGHGVVVITDKEYEYEGKNVLFKTIYWHLVDGLKYPQFKSPFADKTGFTPVKTGELIGHADNCFDIETEVLTNNGWKYFKDLMVDDKVATLNMESRDIEFQEPTQYIKRFKEKMHYFFNAKVDFCISGEHNLLLDRGWFRNKLKLEPIEKIKIGKPKMVTRGNWMGQEEKYFKLPSIRIAENQHTSKELPQLELNMDDWLAFLGIMIADGNVRKKENGVSIAQSYSYPNKIKKIDEVISKLPFKCLTRDRKQFEKYNALKIWQINDKRLATYLQNNVGSGNTKKAPDFIKNLSKRQISIFLEYFFMGDGFERVRDNRGREKTYYPGTSKILADQLQELILKSGGSARIAPRVFKSINYEVKSYFSDASYFNPREVEIIDYNDFAYCVSVPNKTLYVRRNGRAIFLGNTGHSTGSHLHFGLKPVAKGENWGTYYNVKQKNGYNGAINPEPYLPKLSFGFTWNFAKNLKLGDKGIEVTMLQKALTKMGFLDDKIDGHFGNNTKRAVLAFQVFHKVVIFPVESLWGYYFGAKSRAMLNSLF